MSSDLFIKLCLLACLLAGVACVEHKWTMTENQWSAGSSRYWEAKTVEQCLEFCVVNVDCVGVDVYTTHEPPSCWPHFNLAEMRRNARNTSGVNQYRLTQRCRLSTPAPNGINNNN